ncbi:hypothetical protein N9D31_00090 [Oligoflexaceae bacterium]|nr:hypothetical protein [Oligoflexaceae bacterium]
MLSDAAKKTWPVKLTAILFIVMILLGNMWVFQSVLGVSSPAWLANASGICIFSLVLMIPLIAHAQWKASQETSSSSN